MTVQMKPAVLFLTALTLQVPVLIVLAMANVNAMNPDGAVYIRLADYWLRGQFDMAVSGYWGPMLSWLIAPFRLLDGHPALAARLATAISAIVFLIGGIRILLVSRLPRLLTLTGSVLIALFAAWWSVAVISPDLLASGLMLLGLSFLLDPGAAGAGKRPILAGLLLGSAYLGKAVALPLGLGILLLLAVLRAASGAASRSATIRSASQSVLALLLVALPWIVVLSLHYGRPTFSTSGRINLALAERTERVPPGLKHRGLAHPSFITLHVPRPGRISSWEDPTEMQYVESSTPRARRSAGGLVSLKRASKGMASILGVIKGWDLLGLGIGSMILGFLFHYPWGEGFRREPWRLSLSVAAPLVGIYTLAAPVEAPRYFLLAYPFLVASAAGLCIHLARGATGEAEPHVERQLTRVTEGLAVALVFASFAYPLAFDLREASRGSSNQPQYELARDLASELGPGPEAIAEVGARWHVGYYTAFLTGRPWHGRSIAEPGVAELVASGAEVFVVGRGSATDRALEASADFEPLDEFPTPIGGLAVDTWPVRVYRMLSLSD